MVGLSGGSGSGGVTMAFTLLVDGMELTYPAQPDP